MDDEDAVARPRDPSATRPLASVSSRVAASWRRSRDYGVSPDTVDPSFAGDVDDGSLFYESGRRVLRGLQESLAGEPVSVMLVGPDGQVLSREGEERRLLRALDSVHLAPGFDYSERETGTTGLGLALADRAPTLVRGNEHYCARLRDYTCAAVPVDDPATGALAGTVNLTTWSRRSYRLLLALARTAARETEALMLARGRGPACAGGTRPGSPTPAAPRHDRTAAPELGVAWRAARDAVAAAVADGRVVAVVGEPGTGRTRLLTEAHACAAGHRLRVARPPAARDLPAWLALWAGEPVEGTTLVLASVDRLPAWATGRLVDRAHRVDARRSGPAPLALTAENEDGLPPELSALVDVVVTAPPLRRRTEDVVPLARHFARRFRGAGADLTPAAEDALSAHHWPGNVAELRDVVRAAVTRSTVLDVRDLPGWATEGSRPRLTRLESVERDEIARCLATPGTSITAAASELGMSRSTVYRRIARYGLPRPDDEGRRSRS